MSIRNLVLASLAVFFISSDAHAQWLFAPAFSYRSTEYKDDDGDTTKSSVMQIHPRLGYRLSNQFYVGGVYEQETTDVAGTSDPKLSIYGPSVGYYEKNFFAMAHYLLMGEYKLSSTSSWIEGSGPQLDIGYVMELNSTFSLGPQFTYRSIEFKKLKVNGAESDISWTITEIFPMIAIFAHF